MSPRPPPLKKLLSRESLFRADFEGVKRLAKWLGIELRQKEGESDGSYRGRLINAIQRWEKDYARSPRRD